jgi:hypothetical protein
MTYGNTENGCNTDGSGIDYETLQDLQAEHIQSRPVTGRAEEEKEDSSVRRARDEACNQYRCDKRQHLVGECREDRAGNGRRRHERSESR